MPASAFAPLVPYAAMAGMGLLFYRRARRQFGRQPWRPKRTVARLVLLAVVLSLLMLASVAIPGAAWTVGIGAACGVVLGTFGVRFTRVEWHADALTYVPNPWIGAALTLLLLGRLAWRFLDGGLVQSSGASPLTLAFAATLIGYFLAYTFVLMRRMRALASLHPVAGGS